ncbi:MAG: decaprenyl-phosphate phosphoribosyltransferase [Myxococcota bacterium]|nr:decaprenyl-phosphate phosphoribosyltransferase [Myxococcota bacterium]
MSLAGELLRSLRPHQWVKNLFVLAPLVFAKRADDVSMLLDAALAFLLFSLLSGCVYLLNDIVDVDSDRAHPTKRDRPIAAGRLPLKRAKMALAVLLLGAVGTSFALSIEFAAVGMAYFTLNVGYSFALKHVPFLDVTIIASGFILRLFGGAFAIDVPLSIWLGTCTFLLAMYLGLGKRKHELMAVTGDGHKARRVLARYDITKVRLTMSALAVLTTAAYAAYTVFGETAAMFDPRDLVWTIPFVMVGLMRFNMLTGRAEQGRSPTDLMLTDGLFITNLVAWAVAVVFLIYQS